MYTKCFHINAVYKIAGTSKNTQKYRFSGGVHNLSYNHHNAHKNCGSGITGKKDFVPCCRSKKFDDPEVVLHKNLYLTI